MPDGLDGHEHLAAPARHRRACRPRKFFWHFPHYNNQGGRPAGAVRDGDWKFITYYDTGETQLFNLKDDIGETNNLADRATCASRSA